MKQNKYDVVIIGGGPGGCTAAMYCARSGLSVLMIEKISAGGQMAQNSQIDNYPGFDKGIDGFELGERMEAGAVKFGAETDYANVNSVELTGDVKKVCTSKGCVEAKAVVLATGAIPRPLGVPDEERMRGRGVAYCATCDGLRFKDKTVVVVGGGNSAAADALYLSKICKKVYLVHRKDKLSAAQSYDKPLAESGVEFIWNSRVTGIMRGDRVTGVRVENDKGVSREIDANGLFIAIGRMPDTELFKGQVELDKYGYIVADETTRTNVAGVFAAGDVRTKAMRQIITAAADGAVAAHFIEQYLAERHSQS